MYWSLAFKPNCLAWCVCFVLNTTSPVQHVSSPMKILSSLFNKYSSQTRGSWRYHLTPSKCRMPEIVKCGCESWYVALAPTDTTVVKYGDDGDDVDEPCREQPKPLLWPSRKYNTSLFFLLLLRIKRSILDRPPGALAPRGGVVCKENLCSDGVRASKICLQSGVGCRGVEPQI